MKKYNHLTIQRDSGDFAYCRKAGVTDGFDYALERQWLARSFVRTH